LASHAEISTQHRLVTVDKEELTKKLESVSGDGQGSSSTLQALREAVAASAKKAEHFETKLGEERSQRSEIERSLRKLQVQHDDRTNELESATQRLRDAEELVQKHAEEARTHREAVMAGLDKVTDRDLNGSSSNNERLAILQKQVDSANAMVRQNQAAADAASEKLRRAEERIAGLEAYQEQASREGLSIRKQLQAYMKENQGLGSEKAELEQRLERHMLETNALSVQHASLRDILGERGVNASEKRRSRALDSPITARFSTPDLQRVKELEAQLEANAKNHEDLKMQFEEVSQRGDQMKREYEEKLTALDNDHQAAVKYLRGTEKMLSKMKQELQRVKNENGDLKKKIDKAKEDGEAETNRSDEWESEREKLRAEFTATQSSLQNSVSELESRITTMQGQLQTAETELQSTKMSHTSAQKDLSALQATHSQSRDDIERLQKENAMLEERAKDAENKVQLLLDQVETSVDNYRRQSRLSQSQGQAPTINGNSGHQRQPSDTASEASNHVTSSHTRNTSSGGDSTFSAGGESNADGRNSMALDSLASELDALRTHWETTNKNYRLSDRFDFEKNHNNAGSSTSVGGGGALMDWRRGLELDDDSEANKSAGTSTVGEHSDYQDLPTPTATEHQSTAHATVS